MTPTARRWLIVRAIARATTWTALALLILGICSLDTPT